MSHHDHHVGHHGGHHDRHHGGHHDRHHDGHHDRHHGGCCCGHHRREFHRDRCCEGDRGWGDDFNPFGFQRHFVSDEEVIEVLEDYLSDLENEAQGVREAIAEMRIAMAEARAEAAPVENKPEKKKK